MNYESPEQHYSVVSSQAEDSIGTVTISVSCAEIANRDDVGQVLKENHLIPENGVIIPSTEYAIKSGDTAFSVLRDALTENKIHFDYSGISDKSVYVRGINNIYEYDCGDLSGWMYSVNGIFPTISSSEYILQDGDNIFWQYSCDLGRDIGDTYYPIMGSDSQ